MHAICQSLASVKCRVEFKNPASAAMLRIQDGTW
jgi:hypothetical protein